MRSFIIPVLLLLVVSPFRMNAQVAQFTAPDTVCVNEPIHIQNTSTGGSNWFWNFCSGNLFSTPTFTNLPNIGGELSTPVFLAIAKDGANYYAFITNNTGELVRYSFGVSLDNTPTVTNFGSIGGVILNAAEGVQIIQDINGWHVVVVGGTGDTSPSYIAKVDFGTTLANAPTNAVNWGNIGNLSYPHDLYITNEGGNWYGFTVNVRNNTITRFSFGNSVANMPTAVNLGNIGGLDHPVGVFAIQDVGNWHLFITNDETSSISRVDFGASLLNTPTGVNLGSGGGIVQRPRDISIVRDCGRIFALVACDKINEVVRLDFANDIRSNFTASKLNAAVSFQYPHSISSIFRDGNNLYAFITNAVGNVLSKLVFNSCNNATPASSALKDPPDITYNVPGRYTINLLMDASLPTQGAYCKEIVVINPPVVNIGADRGICPGGTLTLDAGPGFSRYSWSTGETTRTITISAPGTYSVTVGKGSCTATDDVIVSLNPALVMTPTVTDVTCVIPLGQIAVAVTGGTAPYTYYIGGTNNGTDNVFENLRPGLYTITVTDALGCGTAQIIEVKNNVAKQLDANGVTTPPTCFGNTNGIIDIQVTVGTPPFEYSINGSTYQSAASFTGLAAGNYVVNVRNAYCNTDVPITLTEPTALRLNISKSDEYCGKSNGAADALVRGGVPPYTYYWNNNPGTGNLSDLSAGVYELRVVDKNSCEVQQSITVDNIFLPPLDITNSDTTIHFGQSVELHAVNAVDYLWSPADGLSCTTCPDPIATPRQTTTYTVTTPNGKNCVNIDQVTVNLIFTNGLYVPNAFSPNGDGINDLFTVKSIGIKKYNIRIYNRWGQEIFASEDISRRWDGKYNGEPQPMGAFVYFITYSFYGTDDKEMIQKGTITLIR